MDVVGLRPYATARQLEIMEAVERTGSKRAAAVALKISRPNVQEAVRAVETKAVKQGYSPAHDLTHPVPDGQKLRGVSTYYDGEGNVRGQWVKSAEDKERMLELYREAISNLVVSLEAMKRIAKPTKCEDLLVGYPISDHHFGMLSWHEETDHDYDLNIASQMLAGAMDHLVDRAPKSKKALIGVLGDYFHYDSFESVTPRGRNQLDSDTRFPRMIRAGLQGLIHQIARALENHQEVEVIIELGNHDPASAIWLMLSLQQIFSDNPRVTINSSPKNFHYYRHGKTLIGVHHGHGPKMADLPLIMATDRAADWGLTENRYWWSGHVHHDQMKDIQGVKVESFRILAPGDAWANSKGYRSKQSMVSIIYDPEHGEVSRNSVAPAMFMGAA